MAYKYWGTTRISAIPFLFNIYINDLIEELVSINKSTWAYADDVPFGFENKKEFEIKMTICENWAKANKMVINDEKCELMVVKGSQNISNKYESRKTIKYLGIRISKTCTLNEHYEMCRRKWASQCTKLRVWLKHVSSPPG